MRSQALCSKVPIKTGSGIETIMNVEKVKKKNSDIEAMTDREGKHLMIFVDLGS